jgi:hypothetical protein
MFDSTSRYAGCETAVMEVKEPDGSIREIRYVRRRFIQPADETTILVAHSVNQGERLDNITARYLGDPVQFWRICDANEVMDAGELEVIGKMIKIAMPGL